MMRTKADAFHKRVTHVLLMRLAVIPLAVASVLLYAGSDTGEFPASGETRIERTLSQLREAGSMVSYSELFDPESKFAWTVYLPNSPSEDPPGVLVYVSPGDSGPFDSRWRSSLDKYNLAYVAADNSGNEVLVAQRMALAILGLDVLGRKHTIDSSRIYVSGFSGGGQVASTLAAVYPELFRGGLYICGADFWEDDYAGNLERLRQNRFVFLTGSKDFSRISVRKVHRKYREAGVHDSELMVVPRMGHQHPDASDFAVAMAYLLGESDELER